MTITKVWKPYGITSIEFVKKFKNNDNKSIQKITCVGKLDPLAQGELIVLTNEDTKKMKECMKLKKRYIFDLIIGIETESHDCLSRVLQVGTYLEDVSKSLSNFIEIYNHQQYPLVSSYVVKHKGIKNPLWWFYMNGYRNIKLPSKDVKIDNYKIHNIKKISFSSLSKQFSERIGTIKDNLLCESLNTQYFIEHWKELGEMVDTTHVVIKLEMDVSSGFYVRRFCHDFGKYLNSCGMAHGITRITNYN